ncbi:hypothetical protein BIW11_10629, partial [Tropilaelaps mercedesae]
VCNALASSTNKAFEPAGFYRFGTTAVPSDKALKEYIGSQESYKGYIVKGWYPTHQFLLHLSGGKGYHVFSSEGDDKSTVFDSLLQLCASQSRSLFVEYAYAARFESKPGVLIPNPSKHCFIFYELIYQDNMNYLPRYDPIATRKPEVRHLRKVLETIGESGVASLELKYDPFVQEIFEDVWKGILGEMSRTFVEKFVDVKKDKAATSSLASEAADLAERAEVVVRRITTQEKVESPEKDKIPFPVEALNENADDFKPVDLSKLFR